RVRGNAAAQTFQKLKPELMTAVLESFELLRAQADLVLVEGAGSAAEVNLREHDIANMGFAHAAGVPVILVGDIDRGGVIAQIVGTRAVLSPQDVGMVAGFLINKFRGDASLFANGLAEIERHTGWPSLGLIPHLPTVRLLPEEDAMALTRNPSDASGRIVVAVLILPMIANFDDLDPLKAEPDLRLVFVHPGDTIPHDADLVLLPGSKATISDLCRLREAGLHHDLAIHRRRGGRILGICGGYQMLGRRILDPGQMEGPQSSTSGLGFLEVETILTEKKSLAPVEGQTLPDGTGFSGYEMHLGHTGGADRQRPFARFADGRTDGARSIDGLVMGTYVHGLFVNDEQRSKLLKSFCLPASAIVFDERIEAALDALAEHLSRHTDLDRILSLAH
ncbi:MAG: cobyric acid synthase, partial [Alphaproteobacteria bacterium]|nr:cobyric acid synthase [Alphaproteobacteria bacterium]